MLKIKQGEKITDELSFTAFQNLYTTRSKEISYGKDTRCVC